MITFCSSLIQASAFRGAGEADRTPRATDPVDSVEVADLAVGSGSDQGACFTGLIWHIIWKGVAGDGADIHMPMNPMPSRMR